MRKPISRKQQYGGFNTVATVSTYSSNPLTNMEFSRDVQSIPDNLRFDTIQYAQVHPVHPSNEMNTQVQLDNTMKNYHETQNILKEKNFKATYGRYDINKILSSTAVFSKDELKSLQDYTDHHFSTINKLLVNRVPVRLSVATTIFNIDTAFRKVVPLKEPLKVYRGLKTFDFDFDIAAPYLSTSLNRATALNFAGGYLLEIEVLPGVNVIPLKDISIYPHEDEILLPRTGKVTIVKHSYDETSQTEIISLKFEHFGNPGLVETRPNMYTYKDVLDILKELKSSAKIYKEPSDLIINSWDTVKLLVFLSTTGYLLKKLEDFTHDKKWMFWKT